MARMDEPKERSVTSRKCSEAGAALKEEKRAAAPVGDDDECHNEATCCADDDKSAIVLLKEELLPYGEDEANREMLELAIHNMREQEDWLVQHEAIVSLRRLIVHHAFVIEDHDADEFTDILLLGCDNLRSALSKNALLAFAECFEFLSSDSTLSLKFLKHPALLDVLLRRASCEKKFLRDAATYAVEQMVYYLASRQLIRNASAFAKNKNARLCGNAAKVVSSSLQRLKDQHNESIERIMHIDGGKHMIEICQALATFRSAKDKSARNESAKSFVLLGEVMGKTAFDAMLSGALKDPLTVSRIINEVFPVPIGADHSKARRSSLRERMLLQ